MKINDVAADLYGLPPEDVTAARNKAAKPAKAGGDADLAKSITQSSKKASLSFARSGCARRFDRGGAGLRFGLKPASSPPICNLGWSCDCGYGGWVHLTRVLTQDAFVAPWMGVACARIS